MLNYSLIRDLDIKYGTPFYLMQPDVYRQNVNQIRHAFLSRYPKLIVGYSFKTNYTPALCNLAREEGCYAEVVSEMEYELALSAGFKSSKIIFNGPVKTQRILYEAFSKGSIVNLDSMIEVELAIKYKQMYPHQDLRIGLRINMDLRNGRGDSTIQNGLKASRFGFSVKSLEEVIPKILSSGILIESLHGHTSSNDRAISNYLIICDKMLFVMKRFRLSNVAYFDIGGGFFGASVEGIDTQGKPTFEDYAAAIIPFLRKDAWFSRHQPYLVIEPGVSVVANVFSFVSKIFQIKEIHEKHYITIDGSIYDVKPTMHALNLPFEILSRNDGSGELINANIVGSTCMEKDIIIKDIFIHKPDAGDYVCIHGVGAYTLALTPNFINFLPPILVIWDDMVSMVRRRQTIQDVLTTYIL